ncbi:MAG: BON domain-containing protein [Verrucomicrobiota bacterium]|nr:BON domain-containing protein [Verrucomicrobiota bacterium]
MKRTLLTLLSICALVAPAFAADPSPSGTPAAADNTGRNARDRSGDTKTSGDQSNDPADIKITAAIRRAVVGDGSLSMTAKNVKIITAGGVVTLRGPVKTPAEKTRIGELARKNAGKAQIVDQLEVKGQTTTTKTTGTAKSSNKKQ